MIFLLRVWEYFHTVTDASDKRFGELMGFSAKSIESFVNNNDDLLSDEEVGELIGFPNYFVNMRLSRSDREGSMQYLKNTYRVLLEQYPDIFSAYNFYARINSCST